MVGDNTTMVRDGDKSRKKIFVIGAVFVLIAIVLVVAIIAKVIVNNEKYEFLDSVAAGGEGIEIGRDIVYKYDTISEYTVQDAVADFEKGMASCGNAGCRVNLSVSYARFVLTHSGGDIKEVKNILGRVDKDLDNVPDTVRLNFYVAVRDFLSENGFEEDAAHYDALMYGGGNEGSN